MMPKLILKRYLGHLHKRGNSSRMNCEENGDGSTSINNISTQISRNPLSDRQQKCVPLAMFTACSNSHPFDERKIHILHGEEQPVKIGRAVVRFQPAANNAIFDCKVLSRNHAIMWYKDDHFYIKDTRSSNGTFINNERLSNSGEESAPHVLNSGDILQLGVEIVDNAKKVASGCVMCIVTLLNERGEECVGRLSGGGPANDSFLKVPLLNDHFSLKYTLVPNDKLFVMGQYMREAKFREDMLGQKLHLLEEQLAKAQEALETSWHALINEEQLLSRIETLESQLMLVASKNTNHKQISEEISQIHSDRTKAELFAKESLRKTEERMYETTMSMHTTKGRLMDLEEENAFLQEQSQAYHQELLRQRSEYEELLAKYNEVNECIAEKEKAGICAGFTNNKSCDYTTNEENERNLAASSTNGLDDKVIEEKHRSVEEEGMEREDGDELGDSSVAIRLRHGRSVAESGSNRQEERDSTDDHGKRRHIRHSSDEQSVPNVSFIGEDQDRRCSCGRSLLQPPENNCSSADVQVLLMCTVPFVVVLAIILLPLLNWVPVFPRTIVSTPVHHEPNQQRSVTATENNFNGEMVTQEVDGEEQTHEEGIE